MTVLRDHLVPPLSLPMRKLRPTEREGLAQGRRRDELQSRDWKEACGAQSLFSLVLKWGPDSSLLSLENLLEMHISRPHPRLAHQNSGGVQR